MENNTIDIIPFNQNIVDGDVVGIVPSALFAWHEELLSNHDDVGVVFKFDINSINYQW